MGLLDFLFDPKREEREEALENIRTRYQDIDIPDIDRQKLALQQLVYGGDVGSEFRGIQEDPALRGAQMQALQRYQDIAGAGGLTDTDRARLEEINAMQGQQERAQRGAILRGAQMRGVGGSGLELASQLQAQQAGAGRRAMGGWQTARAAAEHRALQAIQGAGQMGGQIRGQDYGIASDRASALDAINRFNANARMRSQMANVDIANRQQMANKGLYQQQFQNQMQRAGGQTQADIMGYNEAERARKQRRKDVGNLVGTAGRFF